MDSTNIGNFSFDGHTHDGRYYTETEIDTKLSGKESSLGFTPVQQGGGTGQGANKVKIGWAGGSAGLKCTVDSTDIGSFSFDGHSHDDKISYPSRMSNFVFSSSTSSPAFTIDGSEYSLPMTKYSTWTSPSGKVYRWYPVIRISAENVNGSWGLACQCQIDGREYLTFIKFDSFKLQSDS